MGIFHALYDELISFFGIGDLITMFRSGDYSRLLTLDGILSSIGPVIPLLLVVEIARGLLYRKFRIEDYKVPFFIYVFNRFASRFISIAAVAFFAGIEQAADYPDYGQERRATLSVLALALPAIFLTS